MTPSNAAVSPTTTSQIEVSPNIERLTPYRHGKSVAEVSRELGITGMIKLASNENSLGPSPKAIEAMGAFARQMHQYPDAGSYDLRMELASRLDVSPEGIVFGNGSDDVIHLLGITFPGECDEVVQGHPSFVRYEAAATLNNCRCHLTPLTSDWVHDLDAMAERVNERTRIVFITNPNNPTGTIVGATALARFLERMPKRVITVIDEAYFEYAAVYPEYPDCLPHVRDNRNVVVLRTFSKAYGLAGLRIGYGLMRPEIAGWLNRTREPFNVNAMAQAAAIAALDDQEHVERSVEMNEAGKQQIYVALESLRIDCTPTYGNFIWIDTGEDCRVVYDRLLHEGVIVRTGDIFGAPNHIRVTIGTVEENEKLVNGLTEVLR